MNIKLITIDFWNTLFNTESASIRNSARLKVLMQTLADLNIEFSNEQFNTMLNSSWQYYNDKWMNEVRTPAAAEVLSYIWNKMDFPKNTKALEYLIDFFEKSILYFPPQMEPNAEYALEQLSQKYTLGIISDTGFSPGRMMSQMMEEIGIKKYLSGFSYSDETGVAKPHPKAFNTLLQMFNTPAANALHIGDIEKTDIEGAKNAGMKAIRYDGNAESTAMQNKNNETKADAIMTDWKEIVKYCL